MIMDKIAANINISIPQVDPDDMLTSVLTTAYAVAGIVAIALLVYGGITMSTAAGDPTRVKKAKTIIISAIIGLVIVLLAAAITVFALGSIK